MVQFLQDLHSQRRKLQTKKERQCETSNGHTFAFKVSEGQVYGLKRKRLMVGTGATPDIITNIEKFKEFHEDFKPELHIRLFYRKTIIDENDDACHGCYDIQTWHEILGHCNFKDMLKLENVTEGMEIKGKIDTVRLT